MLRREATVESRSVSRVKRPKLLSHQARSIWRSISKLQYHYLLEVPEIAREEWSKACALLYFLLWKFVMWIMSLTYYILTLKLHF